MPKPQATDETSGGRTASLTEGRVSDADKRLGAQLRELRRERGLTQGALAGLIGIAHTQIHKYECGVNRLSVVRMLQMAEALELAPSDLLERIVGATAPARPAGRLELDTVRSIRQIKNERQLRLIKELVEAISEAA